MVIKHISIMIADYLTKLIASNALKVMLKVLSFIHLHILVFVIWIFLISCHAMIYHMCYIGIIAMLTSKQF